MIIEALKLVIAKGHNAFDYIERATPALEAVAKYDPEAAARVNPDIPELGLYLARAKDAMDLLSKYADGAYSEAEAKVFVSRVHESAEDLEAAAFKIYKFIKKAGVDDDITNGLHNAALDLGDANLSLAKLK